MSRTRRLLLGAIAALTAAAGAMHYAGAPDVLSFVVAGVALAGIAWVVSFATEEVGERFGPAVTGVLQSTLGNLPEFFVVIFALSAGEVVVAQFSILGSIFANALLVLGLVIVVGALHADDGVMRFSARLPMDTTTLLLLADLAISVVKNSVAQVAAFLWPALVIVSLLFSNRLTFDIAVLYVGALFLTTLSVWQVTGDGEATPFEGAALVATYIVLAVFTLYE